MSFSGSRRVVVLVVVALLTCLGVASADYQFEPAVRADVWVRGKRTLGDALTAALRRPLTQAATPATVSIVLDPSPHVLGAEEALLGALLELGREFPAVDAWRVGVLGEPLSPAEADVAGLARPLLFRLATEPRVIGDTLASLDRTLDTLGEGPHVVLYLADWHFEDDAGLTDFVEGLRTRRIALSVVGSEAAFNRAWNDAFFPPDRGEPLPDGGSRLYAEGVGRAPFGPRAVGHPWRGGETAWPHLPQYLSDWTTEFPTEIEVPDPRATTDRPGGPPTEAEDLGERRGATPTRTVRRWFPLPSGFGSYALSHVAQETGGRYVLWSWNPSGRSDVVYDFAKLDLHAPDLRPRAEILADVRARPLARALVDARHLICNPDVSIARVCAPLTAGTYRPRTMAEPRGGELSYLSFHWSSRDEHRQFLRVARHWVRAADQAIDVLDRAIRRTPDVPDDVDRRYLADARLFRHLLAVSHFVLGEALVEGRRVPASEWRGPAQTGPGLTSIGWIGSGGDPDAIRVDPRLHVHDEEAAEALIAERARLLRVYGGTPWGEQVARNTVYLPRPRRWRIASGEGGSRAPAESAPETGPVTPRGSGGTGAPSTGR